MSEENKVPQVDEKVQEVTKSLLESRTVYSGVVLGLVVSLIPGAAPFVAANPEVSAWLVAGIMTALRYFTNKPVTAKPSLDVKNLIK